MNSKSENAVQNTNTVSTSEERSQAHSPVVISRRRLLRAGVSGIPILLTMHGIAPAEGTIATSPSAASAMMYGNNIYDAFKSYKSDDNLVWTDNNGFIVKNGSRYYEDEDVTINLTSSSGPTDNPSTIHFSGSGDSEGKDVSVTYGVFPTTIGKFNYYLRKCNHTVSEAGKRDYELENNWYTDLVLHPSSSTTTTDVPTYIKQNLSSFISTDKFTFSSDGVSCTLVTSSFTDVSGADNKTYYRVNDPGSSFIAYDVTVTYNANSLTFTDGEVLYSNDEAVTFKFTVFASLTVDVGAGEGNDTGDGNLLP